MYARRGRGAAALRAVRGGGVRLRSYYGDDDDEYNDRRCGRKPATAVVVVARSVPFRSRCRRRRAPPGRCHETAACSRVSIRICKRDFLKNFYRIL